MLITLYQSIDYEFNLQYHHFSTQAFFYSHDLLNTYIHPIVFKFMEAHSNVNLIIVDTFRSVLVFIVFVHLVLKLAIVVLPNFIIILLYFYYYCCYSLKQSELIKCQDVTQSFDAEEIKEVSMLFGYYLKIVQYFFAVFFHIHQCTFVDIPFEVL